MFKSSESINEIAGALVKAQASIGNVAKDSKADAGKRQYRYASIGAILDEIRKPLADNGLALLQAPSLVHETGIVGVETRIVHTSGQWVACVSECQCSAGDPQSVGSGQTYMRRYGIMALLGLAAEDDDGQAARGAPTGQPLPPPPDKLDQRRTRFLALCEQKGVSAPNTSGWTVEQFDRAGVTLMKTGKLPEELAPIGPGIHD